MKKDFFTSNLPRIPGCLIYYPRQSKFKTACLAIAGLKVSSSGYFAPHLILDTSSALDASSGIAFCTKEMHWRDTCLRDLGCIEYRYILSADTAERKGRFILRILVDCHNGPAHVECLSFSTREPADLLADFFNRWKQAFRWNCLPEDAVSPELLDRPPIQSDPSPDPLPWVNAQRRSLKAAPHVNLAKWFKNYGETHPEYKKFIFAFLSDSEKARRLAPLRSYHSFHTNIDPAEILAVFPGKPGLMITDPYVFGNRECLFFYVESKPGIFDTFGSKPAEHYTISSTLGHAIFSPAGKNNVFYRSRKYDSFYLRDRDMFMQLVRDLDYTLYGHLLDGARAAVDKMRRCWPAFRDMMDEAKPVREDELDATLEKLLYAAENGLPSTAVRAAARLAKSKHRTPLDRLDCTELRDMRLDAADYGMDICKASFFEEAKLCDVRDALVALLGGSRFDSHNSSNLGLNKRTLPELFQNLEPYQVTYTDGWLSDVTHASTCDFFAHVNGGLVLRINGGKPHYFPKNAYSGFVLDENDHLLALKRRKWGYEDTGIILSGDRQLLLLALAHEVTLPPEDPVSFDYSDLDSSILYPLEGTSKAQVSIVNPFLNFKSRSVLVQKDFPAALWLHPAFYIKKCADLNEKLPMYYGTHVLARDYLGRYWTVERKHEYNMFCALQATLCIAHLNVDSGNIIHALCPSVLMYRDWNTNTRRGQRVSDDIKKMRDEEHERLRREKGL